VSLLLSNFIALASELPCPLITSPLPGSNPKGFRFMGQRFIPDSYMFDRLTAPTVSGRLMPSGLDIMAVLGSERAQEILDQVYDENSNPYYVSWMDSMKVEFAEKPTSDWAQNLYWNWLYSLMPLLFAKDAVYPPFMQKTAWQDKELATSLGSWAELRHDTILYAKQSSSWESTPYQPPTLKGYVEPNPYLYARLASLVRYTREGLGSRDLLLEGFKDKLDLFETLLLFLRDFSIKELENTPLSDSEYENIFCFGKVIQDLVSVVNDPQNPWKMDADDMAVIADVHTDSNTDQCLEEGVGYPLEIFVIVNEGGTIRITRGAIFSYYEFKQPIAERLTDEAWREMLTGDAPLSMPEWVNSFMDISEPQPTFDQYSPDNLYHHEFSVSQIEETNTIPQKMMLLQNYPNPFNPSTTIHFNLPNDYHVKLEIYNIVGQKIRTLINGKRTAGTNYIKWDGKDSLGHTVSSGIYLYKITMGDFVQVKKMILER